MILMLYGIYLWIFHVEQTKYFFECKTTNNVQINVMFVTTHVYATYIICVYLISLHSMFYNKDEFCLKNQSEISDFRAQEK